MNRLILLVGVFVLALSLGLWAVWPTPQPMSEDTALRQLSIEPRDVVLYFVDSAGFSLVSEEQRIAGCNDERQCIAQTIEALAQGSQQLQPVLPGRTRVLGVEVEGDLVRIDFSRDLVDRHPGGGLSELLTVHGLTNTLAVNFPELHRLQILIEGKIESTLKGHVDISRPLKAEFRYSYVPGGQDGSGDLTDAAEGETSSGMGDE
jgi:spore germination protein GerM